MNVVGFLAVVLASMTRLKKRSTPPSEKKRPPRTAMESYLRPAGPGRVSGGGPGSPGMAREDGSDPPAGAAPGVGAGERRQAEPGRARSVIASEVKTRLGPRNPAPPDAVSLSRERVTEPQADGRRSAAGVGMVDERSPARMGKGSAPPGETPDSTEASPLRSARQYAEVCGVPGLEGDEVAIQDPASVWPGPVLREMGRGGDQQPNIQGQKPPPVPSPRTILPRQGSPHNVHTPGPPPQLLHPGPSYSEHSSEGRSSLISEEQPPDSVINQPVSWGPLGLGQGPKVTGAWSPLFLREGTGGPLEPGLGPHSYTGSDIQFQLFNMQNLMKALPTRIEMECQLSQKLEGHAARLERMMKQELQSLQESLSIISQKINTLEQEFNTIKENVSSVEEASTTQKSQLRGLAIQVMDLENRHRRNNIRFRGIPDSVGTGDLKSTIITICNFYLNHAPHDSIEIDRVHRVPGPRGAARDQPRDVIARIHFFSTKESIMRAAWDKGPFVLEGKNIILLQDLSSKTLKMRRALRPLLDAANQQGASYRWGFPFSVTFRHNGRHVYLRSKDQLPAVFDLLGVRPFPMPDWLEMAIET